MKIQLNQNLLHSIQLVNAKLIKIECEKVDSSSEINPERVQVDFDTDVNIINEKEGTLRLEVIVKEEHCFEAIVKYEGLFKIVKEVKSEEALKVFLEIQAIPLLLSYVRETMNNAFLKMEIDMNMPVIDMNQIYANYLAMQE